MHEKEFKELNKISVLFILCFEKINLLFCFKIRAHICNENTKCRHVRVLPKGNMFKKLKYHIYFPNF